MVAPPPRQQGLHAHGGDDARLVAQGAEQGQTLVHLGPRPSVLAPVQGDAPQEVQPPGYFYHRPGGAGDGQALFGPAPRLRVVPLVEGQKSQGTEGPGGIPGVSQRPAQRQQLVEPDSSPLRRLDVPRRVARPV